MAGHLSDVPGLLVGHHSMGDTGVTAIVAAEAVGMIGGVDVRGGGPGTRETDLLAPHNTVERVHAFILSGGSAFGLAAADGAMGELEAAGYGFPVFGEDVPGPRVPIVPAAVIFDLVVGSADHRPGAEDGAAAVRAALAGSDVSSGSVGAGCGATAGVLRGGFGQASHTVGKYVVAAGVVANPVGSVIDPATGLLYGDASQPAVDVAAFKQLDYPRPQLNTTIGVVATNAPVTAAQATRLALAGHDGIARAILPAHSPLDGDTLFAAGTSHEAHGIDVETMSALSAAAAQVVQHAIVDAVIQAEPGFDVPTWRSLAR